MKFKQLSKFWKFFIVFQTVLALLFAAIFVVEISFVKSMRDDNAAKRALVQKTDEDRIGARYTVKRDGKKGDVDCNLYFPDESDEALPVLFNIHGGGFMFGDADEMDSQCEHWAEDWGVAIVSVNYTKLDTKPIDYSVEEITDTMKFFANYASGFESGGKTYTFDTNHFYVLGHSAGGHLATRAAIEVASENTFRLAGQILCCPWTTGLPDKVDSNLAPAFFSLGGADEISQRSSAYQQALRNAGVDVTVKEYEGGLHPFIHTPYPELATGLTEEEKAEYITDEQIALAHKAEEDIKAWIAEMNQR